MAIRDMTDGYLDEVKASAAAKAITGNNSLQSRLDYLASYADHDDNGRTRCTLYKDFAPLSFEFVMEVRDSPDDEYRRWFNGGLIFHGAHDGFGSGGAPTFSVSLNPTDGWSVHT